MRQRLVDPRESSSYGGNQWRSTRRQQASVHTRMERLGWEMRRSILLLIASIAAALTFAVAQASADVLQYSYSVDLTGQLFYVGDIPCAATAEPVLITSGTFELRETFAAGASPGDFTGADITHYSYRDVAGVGTITGTRYR